MNFKERNEFANDRAPMMYEKIQSKFLTVVFIVPSVGNPVYRFSSVIIKKFLFRITL